MKKKYQLIVEDGAIDLEDRVNGWLEAGWRLVGGVSVAVIPADQGRYGENDTIGYMYVQAMVLEDDDD